MIAETVAGVSETHQNEFACECAETSCTQEISMTLSEYESVRADPRWFLVRPGHVLEPYEKVVRAMDRYQVVEKTAEPGATRVEEMDPRS